MSRKPLLMVALPALLALMFLGAGCGGGDDESSNDAPPAAASTTESTKPAVSGGSPENCKEFQLAAAEVGQQFASATTGAGSADLEASAKAFDELTSKAPSEVKADFETINTAFAKLAEALAGVDLSSGQAPDQETLSKLQKVMSEIDQAKLSAASARISAWAQANCKA
jgi:hypothetical protein